MKFCDYASAGDTWQEDSAYRVWLPTVLPLPERGEKNKEATRTRCMSAEFAMRPTRFSASMS